MTPRRRRLALVIGIVVGVSIAAALAFSAFRQDVTFYYLPSDVASGKARVGQSIRLGGMVMRGSFMRAPGALDVRFIVTDSQHDVPVTYDKVLPDLFREGAGVIAHGHLDASGTFVADEVLAKHDEKYMPPKMGEAMRTRNGESRSATPPGTPAAGSAPAPATPPSAPAGS